MRTSPATQSRIIMHVEEVDHFRGARYGRTVIGKISAHTSADLARSDRPVLGRRWRPDWIIGYSWRIGRLTDMQTTHQAEHPRPFAVPHRAGRCRSLSGGHEPVRRLRDDAPA